MKSHSTWPLVNTSPKEVKVVDGGVGEAKKEGRAPARGREAVEPAEGWAWAEEFTGKTSR